MRVTGYLLQSLFFVATTPLCAMSADASARSSERYEFRSEDLETTLHIGNPTPSWKTTANTSARLTINTPPRGGLLSSDGCDAQEYSSNASIARDLVCTTESGLPHLAEPSRRMAGIRPVSAFIDMGDSMSNRIMYKYHKSQVHEFEILSLLKLYPGILEALRVKFGNPAGDRNTSVMNIYRPD